MKSLFNWLVLAASALFFQSCIKDQGVVFRNPDGFSTASTEYVDTFSVQMETFRMDSLISSGREFLLAGSYDDQVLGKISAQGFFQFLPEAYPQVCPDSILDEYTRATLILNTGKAYGKFGSDQFGLYRLNDNLDGNRSFFASENPPSFEAVPYLSTLNATRTDKSIRLDASGLGREIITFWKEKKTLTDDAQFLERWKGFALKSLDSVPQVTRFDLQYRDEAAPCFLQVFYRVKKNNQTSEEKILRFRTNLSTVHYFSVSTRTDATVWSAMPANAGLPTVSTNKQAAVQEGGGLCAKLRIPGLLKWRIAQNRKIKVFKAELEIQPRDPSSLPPPDFLRMSSRADYQNPNENDLSQVVLNESQVLYLLQQGYPNRIAAARALPSRLFPYNAEENIYRCNITNHIQDWLDGKVKSECLNVYGSQWTIAVNRMLLPEGSVKLRLYYFPF